jgi:hypothetical protein
MTPDVYSGLFDDDLDAVADRLDEAPVRARADFLRTQPDVVPLAGRYAPLRRAHIPVGRVGLEPTTQGL